MIEYMLTLNYFHLVTKSPEIPSLAAICFSKVNVEKLMHIKILLSSFKSQGQSIRRAYYNVLYQIHSLVYVQRQP